ncbi:MAG: histidine kinase dimerization/phospho-acceptor domain-containing protein, partial [Candidatus Latescibacteria bacterium]|nr:histidine kinase dimerization/phospho-acceptor domain-containing protein [Candidatus Latescibacterota bacterium]
MKDCAGASNGSALKRRILRQEALLRISEAVQEMIQPADLERVVKMCLEEMRRLGLDSRGLSIHRLIDQRTCTIETYLAAQSTPLSRQVTHNENVLRMWKGGRTVYRPDVEENPGGITPEGLEWTRECFGAAIRCILDVPHVNGTFAVSSVQPHAFSDADVEFVEEVAQVVSLGLSRVRDLENMAALVRHVPEGICLIDGSRRLVFANPAAQESLAAAAGLSVGDPVVQIGRYGLEEIVQGKPDGLPLEVHIPGSEQRTFEITGSLIREEVETGGCTLVIRDVTQDRRTLAKILRQYRLASLGQLAAGIAHDFNNSLTLIMGVAKLLDRRDDLPGDACEDVRSIVQQSQRASELVR